MAQILFYILLATLIAIAAFVVWKGGPAERGGVLVYLGASLLGTLLLPKNTTSFEYIYGSIIADLAVAASFLILAIRYSSLWMAMAMIAQGLIAGAHGFHLEDDQLNQRLLWHHMNVWVLATNILTFIAFCIFLGAALANVRRGRRSASQARLAAA